MIRVAVVLLLFSASALATTAVSKCSNTNNTSTNNTSIKTCEDCLKADVSCLWCNKGKKCMDYPTNHVLPNGDDCSLSDARWGVCWLNFEALIISCGIIGGLVLIGITLCICKCCRCCCFKKDRSAYIREEVRLETERQSRKMRQDERRRERKEKNDEIRAKYGLTSSKPQYENFDNE